MSWMLCTPMQEINFIYLNLHDEYRSGGISLPFLMIFRVVQRLVVRLCKMG
ncbi:hypothetical protein Pan161_30490 [Gimesia algae]|uniref:Uncharacterized protein n=1 Tax=Gimesia algae TaxID=2527971 RepID=A0A517VEF0_9PLAN|nr:hypothetical protein Pan161_30490 [Gimesia algae]